MKFLVEETGVFELLDTIKGYFIEQGISTDKIGIDTKDLAHHIKCHHHVMVKNQRTASFLFRLLLLPYILMWLCLVLCMPLNFLLFGSFQYNPKHIKIFIKLHDIIWGY